MGGFSLPGICWILNTTERRKSGRFLECVEENFVISWSGSAPLALTLPGTVPHWTCWLQTDEGWWEMWWSGIEAHLPGNEGLFSTGWRKERGLPWISGGWTSAYSGHCFEGYLTKQPVKWKGPRKAGILKGEEQIVPVMLNDELVGEQIGLAEQGAFPGSQGKKRSVYDLWRKGQESQEVFRNVIRSCRKKVFTLVSLRPF